jgi:hypothetical protein
MAVGLSNLTTGTTGLANNWLNMLRGTAFTAPAALYVKLHTGDPGSVAASNASAVTTRAALSLAAALNGAVALTGTQPSWSMTASETISYISVWDASTSGNFLWSAQLSVAKTVANGDTLTLTTCGLSLTPTAA